MSSETTKKWVWASGLFFVVFLISASTYWDVLKDPTQVLAFNDGNIETALSPAFQFPAALRRIWDNQFFFGSGGKHYMISATALVESIGPLFSRRWAPAVVLGFSALAFFWMLCQYRVSRPAAALAAVFLAGTGVCHNFAVAGLSARPIAMACAALALGFIEQGRQSRHWLPYAVGGGFLGLGIAEVPDVGALFALTTTVVFWWTHLIGKSETKTGALNLPSEIHNVFGLLGKFALYVLFSGLLAWQTINIVFATNIQNVTQGNSESAGDRYAWATQWSIPPEEMWNAISGNYFGCSIRSEEFPYWGRLGRDANWDQTHQGFRNFSMCGWHWGVVPSVLLLALFGNLLIRKKSRPNGGASKNQPNKRKKIITEHLHPTDPDTSPFDKSPISARPWIWMVFAVCFFTMFLMWGKYFPLYRLFWSLPYFGTFRNPEKWNGPFSLVAGIGLAFVVDALWRSLRAQKQRPHADVVALWTILLWTNMGMALVGLLIVMGTFAGHADFVTTRLAEGYAAQAELMWNNAVAASFKVIFIAGLGAVGVWWLLHRWLAGQKVRPWLVLGFIAMLLTGDQLFDNRAYTQGHHYQQYLTQNPLTDFLDMHRTEGRLKLMPPHQPLLNNLRMTLLQIKGYDLFDPVSISRMPTDYATLFQALEKQPLRVWELGALRFCLTLPGGVEQLNQMDGNRGRFVERLALGVGAINDGYVPISNADPQQQPLRLIEFTGALPKYRWAGHVQFVPSTEDGDHQALARLGETGFQPANETLLHTSLSPAELTRGDNGHIKILTEAPAMAELEVEAALPGWLVRSTKFDSDWRVTVDDKPAALLRADYLLQAVHIPAGKHVLTFSYSPSLNDMWLAITVRGVLLVLLVVWLIVGRQIYGRTKITTIFCSASSV